MTVRSPVSIDNVVILASLNKTNSCRQKPTLDFNMFNFGTSAGKFAVLQILQASNWDKQLSAAAATDFLLADSQRSHKDKQQSPGSSHDSDLA